jgi:hypothetical protein
MMAQSSMHLIVSRILQIRSGVVKGFYTIVDCKASFAGIGSRSEINIINVYSIFYREVDLEAKACICDISLT